MTDKRNHKIHSDFGTADYFQFYKEKYGTDLSQGKYTKILRDFHEGLRNLIIEESLVYTLPYIYMELMIRKDRRRPRIVNGKLVNNTPPDWKKTNELWEKDPEAKKKKLVVRYNNSHTSGYVFTVYLRKFKCKLQYRSLYKFNTNRKFQRQISQRIFDEDKDPFDSYLLYK